MRRILIGLFTLLALAGCGQGDTSASGTANQVASSKSLMPADPAIKSLYIQSCYGCHSSGAGKAPRTGNQADWAPRWQQGIDTLVAHTVKGYNNMPPKGMCMNCSEADLAALIRFMAGQEQTAEPGPSTPSH